MNVFDRIDEAGHLPIKTSGARASDHHQEREV
jgi:hypothetical protein